MKIIEKSWQALGVLTLLLVAAGCGQHQASVPANQAPEAGVQYTSGPSVAGPVQPYTIVSQLPPKPQVVRDTCRTLHLTRHDGRYCLVDADDHYYDACRDSHGDLYPAYYDPDTHHYCPLYYDASRDRYYCAYRWHDHFYRRYWGDDDDLYYDDQYDYDHYRPAGYDRPVIVIQYNYSGGYSHHADWLEAVPVIVAAYVALSHPWHHTSHSYSARGPQPALYGGYSRNAANPGRNWNGRPAPAFSGPGRNAWAHHAPAAVGAGAAALAAHRFAAQHPGQRPGAMPPAPRPALFGGRAHGPAARNVNRPMPGRPAANRAPGRPAPARAAAFKHPMRPNAARPPAPPTAHFGAKRGPAPAARHATFHAPAPHPANRRGNGRPAMRPGNAHPAAMRHMPSAMAPHRAAAPGPRRRPAAHPSVMRHPAPARRPAARPAAIRRMPSFFHGGPTNRPAPRPSAVRPKLPGQPHPVFNRHPTSPSQIHLQPIGRRAGGAPHFAGPRPGGQPHPAAPRPAMRPRGGAPHFGGGPRPANMPHGGPHPAARGGQPHRNGPPQRGPHQPQH